MPLGEENEPPDPAGVAVLIAGRGRGRGRRDARSRMVDVGSRLLLIVLLDVAPALHIAVVLIQRLREDMAAIPSATK